MNYWVTIYRVSLGIIVILFLIGIACLFLPKVNLMNELNRQKAEKQQENRRLEAMAEDLRLKQERLASDPEFLEHTSREIGMVKKDEKVIRFTNSEHLVTTP